LFLKRIAGLPGDDSIRLVDDNGVSTNGMNVVGPDRNLYADEPLQLIEKYLENGNGKDFDKLGDDDVYVLGDFKAVSVDSREFGIFPKENIVGSYWIGLNCQVLFEYNVRISCKIYYASCGPNIT